jgi:fatty acid desaturase
VTPQDAKTPHIEWPTLVVLVVTYGLWAMFTSLLWGASPIAAVVLTGFTIAQFSSLQHEALHGHPFRTAWLNEALVLPGLMVTVPYGRFRDTHLAHHHDPILTDPYDDRIGRGCPWRCGCCGRGTIRCWGGWLWGR